MALVVAMFAVGAMLFVACSKEKQEEIGNDNPITEKGLSLNMTVETEFAGIVNQYTLLDDEEEMWRWRQFENDRFVMDVDFIWEMQNVVMFKYIDESSFGVLFEDESELVIDNIVSKGNVVTISTIADNDSVLELTAQLPEGLDLMGLIKELDGKNLANIDGAKFPWGKAAELLYKVAKYVAGMYAAYKTAECLDGISTWTKKCTDNKCMAVQYTCSIVCKPMAGTLDGTNCSQYSWNG